MADRPADEKDRLEFLWEVHGYTNEYIRFADQKAGLVLAIESGLVAVMYAAELHQACALSRLALSHRDASLQDTLLGSAAFLGFLCLLAGASFALLAITPRLWHQFKTSVRERVFGPLANGTPAGAIFWKQVLANDSAEGYLGHVRGMDERMRTAAVAAHVHTLAGVADTKFGWVNMSIFAGAVGAAFAVLALFAS